MELNGAQFVHQHRNILMFEDADLSPLRQVDLEGDLRRVLVWRELNHSRHTSWIFTHSRRVHHLSEKFLAELLDELICFHGLRGEVELPAPKLPKPIDQLSGVLVGKGSSLIRQLGEAALQSSPRHGRIPVFFGRFRQ